MNTKRLTVESERRLHLPPLCYHCGLSNGHYHGLCRGCFIHFHGLEWTKKVDEELRQKDEAKQSDTTS